MEIRGQLVRDELLGLRLTLDKGLEIASEPSWLKAMGNYEDSNNACQALGAHRNLSKEFIHFI